ncbi:PAS domain S-box protein [Nocardia otitidiscaviarum]|uniref:PAS domain S-box protein n=1 Tax=Nocardia otitidiscaviarum TaxID=1823 RepID=A0A516NN21_9NOCA|nr:histidine kinase dimerization/phosphoacceptor domain -containing protein [Nocardia otitidiscaviarum]MCP9624445.1 PAS domain S-box protein [Nocardia otitidiscaviarum]QDP80303.1 PAS domain S-box protein [Nocardia otitidiscaviarum]
MKGRKAIPYLAALSGLVVVTTVLWPLRDLIRDNPGTSALVYVLVVLLVALRWGRTPALATSVAAILVWNSVFLSPYLGWFEAPAYLDDWILLAVFVITAGTVGSLAATTKRRAEQTEAVRAQVEQLYIELRQESGERRQAEEALRSSESRLRGLFESAPDSVVVLDAAGRIVQANSRTELMFGYPAGELVGRSVESLIAEGLRERHRAHRGNFTDPPDGRSPDAEFRARRRDGSEFPIDVVLNSMGAGADALTIEVFRDITDRKHSDDRIRAALEEKATLLDEIHHRVKNNLQIITSLLSLQTRRLTDRRVQDAFTASQDRIRSMSLIHEKLYQSEGSAQIDAGDYIHTLTGNLIRSYGLDQQRIQLRAKVENVRLGVDIAVPCGLLVSELVTNALKHAFPGDRAGEILVELCPLDGGVLRLLVSDDGVGMPPELDFRTTKSLGLRLVTALAAQLNGVVRRLDATGTAIEVRFAVDR